MNWVQPEGSGLFGEPSATRLISALRLNEFGWIAFHAGLASGRCKIDSTPPPAQTRRPENLHKLSLDDKLTAGRIPPRTFWSDLHCGC